MPSYPRPGAPVCRAPVGVGSAAGSAETWGLILIARIPHPMPPETNLATDAEQEYLESLFWLFEAGLPMTAANLARAMQLSPPTVSEMVGRLERDGYIERGPDRLIKFTESGRARG